MEVILAQTILGMLGLIGIVVGLFFRSVLTIIMFYSLFMLLGIVSFEGIEEIAVEIIEWWENE